jgi:hypothetical protein
MTEGRHDGASRVDLSTNTRARSSLAARRGAANPDTPGL